MQQRTNAAPADTTWPASDFDVPVVADALDAAALRLQCAGFAAEVRSFSLGMDVTRRTLAVYVHRHDPRVCWSSADSDALPAVLPFRAEDRNGHAFTLFSGDADNAIASFERQLMHRRAADALVVVKKSPLEWDPHQLTESDRDWVELHVSEVRALVESSLPVLPNTRAWRCRP